MSEPSLPPSLPSSLPSCPPPEPFYPIRPFGLPTPSCREAVVNIVDRIGLYLVCPHRRCRRARACADSDPVQLPFCFWQHRGTVRFVVQGLLLKRARAQEAGAPPDDGPLPRLPPQETLLGRLAADGLPLSAIARRVEDGADEWSWERDAGALEILAEIERGGPAPGRGESPGGPT